jgi:tripartite-type tricarboxylate transporter receptor subunit TctC
MSLVVALVMLGSAQAGYPERPVTLVVPYAAGGPMDKLARQIGAHLQPLLGQSVVVMNQGGAGGNIGAAAVKRAAPDGYTLLIDHVHMATAPALYRKLDFNPALDFEPLGVVAESALVLISRPEVAAGRMADLQRWMAKQSQVTLANAGIGSASHLCGLLLQSALKRQMTTIPYRGTGPAMLDLLSGQVDLMCDLTANAMPQIQAHKVSALAVTVRQPLKGTALETTPSMDQFGIALDELTVWYGLYAPKGTPAAVTQKISAALSTVVNSTAFRQQLSDAGIQPVTDERSSVAGHRRFLLKEIQRWAPVIKASGDYAD